MNHRGLIPLNFFQNRLLEIDAGKLAEEARYDGIFVLGTNARVTPLNAVLRYRELLMVARAGFQPEWERLVRDLD